MKNAIKEIIIGAMWAVGEVMSAFIPGKIGGAVFAVCEAKEAAVIANNQ
jgi:hypothetical protein